MTRQRIGRLLEMTALGAILGILTAQAWDAGGVLKFALPGALLGLTLALVTRRRV